MTSAAISSAYTGGIGCGSTPRYVFAFSKNGVSILAGFTSDTLMGILSFSSSMRSVSVNALMACLAAQ
jgi:hypothetical protein